MKKHDKAKFFHFSEVEKREREKKPKMNMPRRRLIFFVNHALKVRTQKVDITLRVMVQDEQETRCNFK